MQDFAQRSTAARARVGVDAGRQLDANLLHGHLRLIRDLVPFLGHDRDVAELRDQNLGELVDLRRRDDATGEHAEVHAHLALRRLGLRDEREHMVEILQRHSLLVTGIARP